MYDSMYAVGVAFWLIVWCILFLCLKTQRPAMLWTGIVAGPSGPIGEYWSFHDYWHAPLLYTIRLGSWEFGFEDVFLMFALGGISAGIFEALARRRGAPPLPRVTRWCILRLGLTGLAAVAALAFCIEILGINSGHSLILCCFLFGAIINGPRRWMWKLTVPLSLGLCLVYLLFYTTFLVPLYPGMFDALWKSDTFWGITLFGVPIEEILWAGLTMFVFGPVLRVCSYRPPHPVPGSA